MQQRYKTYKKMKERRSWKRRVQVLLMSVDMQYILIMWEMGSRKRITDVSDQYYVKIRTVVCHINANYGFRPILFSVKILNHESRGWFW